MILRCLTQIAHRTEVPQPTIYQMVKRGVLPRGDALVGRRHYYTVEFAEQIEQWLKLSYDPHKRYEGCQVTKEVDS